MKFKLFSTEIYISFLFVALVAFLLASDRTGLALPTLFAVLIHEIGHLFAMWLLECSPKSIRLIPASVQITRSITTVYRNDILIALAGPVINILLFCVLYLNFITYKNTTVLYYAGINLIVALFNLMPVSGLDGGTVLFSIIAKKHDVNRAMLTLRIITLAIAVILLSFAIALTIKGNFNISIYIVAIYLLMSVLMKM